MQTNPRSDLKVFFSAIGDPARRAMCALSAAESLTDEIAVLLSETAGLRTNEANAFVEALHFADFVVERNSEWHFASEVRRYLEVQLNEYGELRREAHSLLFDIAADSDPKDAGDKVPRYLTNGIGSAYHRSAISPTEGLDLYAKAARNERSGSQWLLARLAVEQQRSGVLPAEAVEPPFLQGMALYREGRIHEAETYLQRVARSKQIRTEVAIACHILGLLKSDEGLLRRSLKQLQTLKDLSGQAHVLHTLGQLVGRERKRTTEAEELLRESLAIEETLGNDTGYKFGQVLVLNTLGQLLGREKGRETAAEKLLLRGLAIAREGNDLFGEAQILHTLALTIGRDPSRSTEAVGLFERSLRLGEELGDKNHQAQVLFNLGKVLWTADQAKAERLLRRSLLLNKEQGANWAVKIVQDELTRRLLGK